MDPNTCRENMKELGCVVVIPTYNNAVTLVDVIDRVRPYAPEILLINDGSTDSTSEMLKTIPGITVAGYEKNRGKGFALKTGLRKAVRMGFRYALTIDSDGQHYPEDIPALIEAAVAEAGTLLVGARNLRQENMPAKNTFANRFSNFWFRIETGIKMTDTQSGFRLYPLEKIAPMKFVTDGYEFELEVLVRAAWKGIRVKNVPIRVYYPPDEERVSHFRPLRDFVRIGLLNTVLVMIALLVHYPRNFFRKLTWANIKRFIHDHIIHSPDSNLRLAGSIALGIFFGIIPLWGYQMVLGGFAAYFLRFNVAVTVLSSNISIPPMIPFILYGSYITGGVILGRPITLTLNNITLELLGDGLVQYLVGSVVFAVVCALVMGSVSYLLMCLFRKKRLADG